MLSNILIFILVLVMVYITWRKRRLYYYSLQFSGPITLPFVMTTFKLITRIHKDFYETLAQLWGSQKPIFKFWIANDLYIVNSQPEDVEILLNTCLEKSSRYKLLEHLIGSNLVTAPVSVWKPRRREFNRCFSKQIIYAFHDAFAKGAKKMVKVLDEICGEEQADLLPEIWKCNIDSAIEIIVGIDPASIEDRLDVIPLIVRGEEIVVERARKFWLLNDFIFGFSNLKKESSALTEFCQNISEKAFALKKQQISSGTVDELESRRLSNHLIQLSKQGKIITETELIPEGVMMMVAASETTSIVLNYAILVLGLFPEIQNRIYEDVCSMSLDNINRMDYLERVIKETMRLLPPFPLILRSIDNDVKLGSFVYPAGSNLVIPIAHIHRRPDLWPDPLKFDPDRFLPEEVAKRHKCAYIPFSFGPRNCIGLTYGMLSMKVALAYIVKHFTIKALNYRSIEEIKVEWHIMAVPKGNRVMFERRTT